MTRHSIKEYAEAIRERYQKGDKDEKTKILDEFTKSTGLHHKAAIRLLNRADTFTIESPIIDLFISRLTTTPIPQQAVRNGVS